MKVHTNDPKTPTINLSVTGQVKKFAQLSPEILSLTGKPEDTISGQVKVIPTTDAPFDIADSYAKIGTDIRFDIEKKTTGSTTYFVVTVHNRKTTPGRYFDLITLETDTTPQRKIILRVTGHIQS